MKNEQATPQEATTLALVYAEVKKLTKHFRLDRHSKNATDDPAASEPTDGISETDRQTLREILERVNELTKTADRKEFTPEQDAALKRIENTVEKALRDFHGTEYRELKTAIERFEKAANEAKTAKQDREHHHYHSHALDFRNSKSVGLFVGLGLILLGSLAVNMLQCADNKRFRDNDLRYRYIEMRNGIGPEELMQLRDIFEFNRAPEVIKKLRKTVGDYERHIRQQTENAARARFNAAEAERLKKEAETVKKGK